MSFVKWSSRTELERLRTDLDRLFGEFFEPAKRGTLSHRHPESDVIIPKVDIYNKNGSMPHMLPQDIEKMSGFLYLCRDGIRKTSIALFLIIKNFVSPRRPFTVYNLQISFSV